MSYIVHVIHVDGTVKQECIFCDVENGESELEQLQELVGGYIEMIPQKPLYEGQRRNTCWVNEDGGPLGLPLNKRATEIANYPILGNLVIVMGDGK